MRALLRSLHLFLLPHSAAMERPIGRADTDLADWSRIVRDGGEKSPAQLA